MGEAGALPAGYAADECAELHFIDSRLEAVVSSRKGPRPRQEKTGYSRPHSRAAIWAGLDVGECREGPCAHADPKENCRFLLTCRSCSGYTQAMRASDMRRSVCVSDARPNQVLLALFAVALAGVLKAWLIVVSLVWGSLLVFGVLPAIEWFVTIWIGLLFLAPFLALVFLPFIVRKLQGGWVAMLVGALSGAIVLAAPYPSLWPTYLPRQDQAKIVWWEVKDRARGLGSTCNTWWRSSCRSGRTCLRTAKGSWRCFAAKQSPPCHGEDAKCPPGHVCVCTCRTGDTPVGPYRYCWWLCVKEADGPRLWKHPRCEEEASPQPSQGRTIKDFAPPLH